MEHQRPAAQTIGAHLEAVSDILNAPFDRHSGSVGSFRSAKTAASSRIVQLVELVHVVVLVNRYAESAVGLEPTGWDRHEQEGPTRMRLAQDIVAIDLEGLSRVTDKAATPRTAKFRRVIYCGHAGDAHKATAFRPSRPKDDRGQAR
jgi:hypothetical protein